MNLLEFDNTRTYHSATSCTFDMVGWLWDLT